MSMELELIKKIHEGADKKCHMSITRNWEGILPDVAFYDRKFFDRVFDEENFYKEINDIVENNAEDCYFSINSFRKKKKLTDQVWHLNAFVLDFDYYKIKEYENLTAKEMYEQYIKFDLPFLPTAVVDSGRGLYVLYTFKHACKAMIATYQSIYQALYDKLKGYGMDAKSMNVTQIIRIPGSMNTKSLRYVEVLELNDTDYQLKDFFHLLPFTREEVTSYKKMKLERLKLKTFKFKDKGYMDTFHIDNVMKIINDFEKLIDLRNSEGIQEGYREELIYLARKRLKHTNCDDEEILEIAHKLNERFLKPLEPTKFKETIPCGNTRCEKISTIIKKLDISETEQKKLQILCKKTIKDSRRAKKARKHKLLNLTKKQQEMLERRSKVAALKNEGHSNTYIANILGVDKSMVTRDLQYINNNRWQFIKKLQDAMKELQARIGTYLFEKKTLFDEQLRLLEWLKMSEILIE